MTMNQTVLDPCCGGRAMWFDKAEPCAVFGDRRSETIETQVNLREVLAFNA